MICCGPVTTFGTEFVAVGCLVLTSLSTLPVVACGVDTVLEKDRFHLLYGSVVHAFVNGMGVGFLLPCLIVGAFVAGVH